MGENVVGFVFATGDSTLLPEMRELVLQGSAGPQVEDKLSRQVVVQEGIVHVGKQPEEEDAFKKLSPANSLTTTE